MKKKIEFRGQTGGALSGFSGIVFEWKVNAGILSGSAGSAGAGNTYRLPDTQRKLCYSDVNGEWKTAVVNRTSWWENLGKLANILNNQNRPAKSEMPFSTRGL